MKEIHRKKLTHYFNILDHNKNGELQEDDFIGVGENVCLNLGISLNGPEYKYFVDRSKEMFAYLLKDLDKDGDKSISLEEWLFYFDKYILTEKNVELLKKYIALTVRHVFELYDVNKDGLITVDEFADMFTIYGISVKYSAKSFVKLDKNNDGVISKQELVLAVKDYFISSKPDAPGNWIFGDYEATVD